MMQVSRKTRYALRATLDLALHYGTGPVRIADIAARQAIPSRFLEGILNQLRQAGLLRSVRGARGGYELAAAPGEITVGDIFRAVEGPIVPVADLAEGSADTYPLDGDGVFGPLWRQAADALSGVYDGVTFADLVRQHEERRHSPLTYAI